MINWRNIFSPLKNLSPDELKSYIAEHQPGSYQLLDVRLPKEYNNEHLPGSKLIPLRDLPSRLDEIDRNKPVIVYCAVGGRSRAAAQFLVGKRFKEVYNLAGGIKKWSGIRLKGPVEDILQIVYESYDFDNVITLAYAMEAGLEQFYLELAKVVQDHKMKEILQLLASFENKHRYWLIDQCREAFAEEENAVDTSLMEGGLAIGQMLQTVRPYLDDVSVLFDIAMSIELQAFDLYNRLAVRTDDKEIKDLYVRLAAEEKTHFSLLTNEFKRVI